MLVPAHPWQARLLLAQPYVQELSKNGLLVDLGERDPVWYPTSSVRTVYRPDAPYMLKLSLALPITNSVRCNLRKELARGVEVHRLLETSLGDDLCARFPSFGIVRDPAWLTVDPPAGRSESGFEVVIRENPWPAETDADAACVAALCAERPDRPGGASRLDEVVRGLAAAQGRPIPEVARDWWDRYLEVVGRPLLWLYAVHGIALEAHQQNSVVVLRDGWPVAYRYRDNQGYYFALSHADRLAALVPNLGAESSTVCDDAVADERFGYYFGINHLLGMIGALGAAGLVDERDLLRDLHAFFTRTAATLPTVPPVISKLLASPRLRCKANLLTRVAGLDELVGPLETQSVYVDIANPIVEAVS
ncbi:MAG: hypothetical protein GEU73_01990 [Chloroflexi bacterium]|nr:hypothetical protein [Chloroflexota bacterium]